MRKCIAVISSRSCALLLFSRFHFDPWMDLVRLTHSIGRLCSTPSWWQQTVQQNLGHRHPKVRIYSKSQQLSVFPPDHRVQTRRKRRLLCNVSLKRRVEKSHLLSGCKIHHSFGRQLTTGKAHRRIPHSTSDQPAILSFRCPVIDGVGFFVLFNSPHSRYPLMRNIQKYRVQIWGRADHRGKILRPRQSSAPFPQETKVFCVSEVLCARLSKQPAATARPESTTTLLASTSAMRRWAVKGRRQVDGYRAHQRHQCGHGSHA